MVDLDEWVMNELYQDLIKTPLWTASAFEKDGEFHFDEIRQRLLHYLIVKLVDKYDCPNEEVKTKYKYTYKVTDYLPLLRQAWGISRALGI